MSSASYEKHFLVKVRQLLQLLWLYLCPTTCFREGKQLIILVY